MKDYFDTDTRRTFSLTKFRNFGREKLFTFVGLV